MEVASEGFTFFGGYPQVGRSGIEDNFEGLGGSTNGNRAEVLRSHEVGQFNFGVAVGFEEFLGDFVFREESF